MQASTLENRLPKGDHWVSLKLQGFYERWFWITGIGQPCCSSLLNLSMIYMWLFRGLCVFATCSVYTVLLYKSADVMTSIAMSRMLHPNTASVERSRSWSPQCSASMSSFTTIPAQSQKASGGSHSITGRSSSQSRAVFAPIGGMEEEIENHSIEPPDCTLQAVMDRITLENALFNAGSDRGLVDGACDNVPSFKDVLGQKSQTLKHQDDASSADSKFSESTNVPRRNLRVHDVAGLILNKVVGSGIFTTPGLVLALTKHKPTSIFLWLIGGIHAMLWYARSSLFSEVYWLLAIFNLAWLYTSNSEQLFPLREVNWFMWASVTIAQSSAKNHWQLNEIFRTPKLLATILFSGFFILLGNTSGNAIVFAKHILLAAKPDTNNAAELDPRLINLIAVGILSIICLLHYFSRRLGLFLNKAFALFKVFFLAAVFIAGVMARHKNDSGIADFGTKQEGANGKDSLAAFIYIIYSYQGWENANYVYFSYHRGL